MPAKHLVFLLPLVLACATCAAAPARKHAETAHAGVLRPQYQRCVDASGGAAPAMQDCIDEEHAWQDRRLNETYRRLIARLPANAAASLRERQRAWIRQRDRDCDPGATPGQGQLFDADSCRTRRTAERAAQLQAQLDRLR
ncbi:lysozyme inhibitor LprI family protein [Lysobacter enzymogenes]|uniref:lysozyme inhibitor LprI family protein n=1 Tax=Lysobacter enzymogenes TaxID=69 RepID=UPI00384EBE21